MDNEFVDLIARKVAEEFTKYMFTTNVYKPVYDTAISSPDDVYNMMKDFVDENENFFVVCLDSMHNVLGVERLYRGTTTEAQVRVAEVFRLAIRVNAVSIIVVHNHPGGGKKPSKSDWDIVGQIRKAGELLGINVLDSVILHKTGYTSMFYENQEG